ncbi:sugar O-acetyltransferase [Neobacillus sp. 3P2-tot-E-2]|uniref:sugar O-acetyltransferase n=1 Tax=Neobacillus sp. 3P2-tot-E-2 TaxID=3132212 RepID=UPI0039A2EE29
MDLKLTNLYTFNFCNNQLTGNARNESIKIGEGTYINFNCNFVDDTKIIIGKDVLFGPAVTIATVGHPINPNYRGYMYADPVKIGDNCWIGAGSIICPGVTIGDNCVIGAGSVVTKDIPANSVAVGNPCKVLRSINEHDMKYYYKDKEITQADLDEEARLR